MSINAYGSSFELKLPSMIVTDNNTGLDTRLPEQTTRSKTDNNDIESTRESFMLLMTGFVYSLQFEQMVRNLNSNIQLNIEHSVNTSIN